MKPEEYAKLLYEVLEDKNDEEQKKVIVRFKSLLARNKETHLMKAILEALEKIEREKAQEKLTHITSASDLNDAQKKELEDAFGEAVFSTNPSLLGGIAVRRQDKLYNATLRKKFESIKSSL